MEKIVKCENLVELDALIKEDDCWRGHPNLMSAIMDRYDSLIEGLPSGAAVRFGTDDFWDEYLGETPMDWSPIQHTQMATSPQTPQSQEPMDVSAPLLNRRLANIQVCPEKSIFI